MKRFVILLGIFAAMALLPLSTGPVLAHPHAGQILADSHTHEQQVVPLGGAIGLEKSVISFHAPQTNMLPWGFVEGTVENPVEGYPVIIQIFKDDKAVHFAQTGVDLNGSYEHKFRVLNSDSEQTSKVFEGDYTVNVFKVVYLDHSTV